jgi:hypothetical protein
MPMSGSPVPPPERSPSKVPKMKPPTAPNETIWVLHMSFGPDCHIVPWTGSV